MSDNSLASLLDWMARPDSNVLWGWNSIAAVDRGKTNLLLAQVYIARFDAGSYLPPINEAVESIGNLYRQHLHNFILDAPRLSFENADLNRSKARLSMQAVGGVQVSMEKSATLWRAVAVHDIDPLQGPRLDLELDLDEVPGTVGVAGQVRLDLRYSDNFVFTFAESEHERRLGGEFFQELFNRLDDEQRVFVLGVIEAGGPLDLRPQSFRLRTMSKSPQSRDPGSADFGEGAVLILIRMLGSEEGSTPGASFRYLIPDDAGKDYSATVIFERERIMKQANWLEAVLPLARQVFANPLFSLIPGVYGKLQAAVATAGSISFAPATLTVGPHGSSHLKILNRVTYSGMQFLARSKVPFKLELDRPNQKLRINWECEATSIVHEDMFNSSRPYFQRWTFTRQHTLRFNAVYRFDTDIENPLLVPEVFEVNESRTESRVDSELPSDMTIDWNRTMPDDFRERYRVFLETKANLEAKPNIKALLERQLSPSLPVGDIISDTIKLNFFQAIIPDLQRIPGEVVGFGRVNPLSTNFYLDPVQPLVRAGGAQQINAVPPIAGLHWEAQALDSTQDDGIVDQRGLYRAPFAEDFSGRCLRVRVSATHPETGYRSSALVTVLRHELTVNPLIQMCHVGETVELRAGQFGDGERRWSIVNAVPGSGTLQPSDKPDGDYTYVAVSEQDRPKGQTYVVDEIQVRNHANGQSAVAHVLVTLYMPELSVRLAETGLPPGQVQLQAWTDIDVSEMVHWSLPLGGPGEIDEASGLYICDEAAGERFVLIFAQAIEFPEAGGHIILPLPLADFPAERGLMSATSVEVGTRATAEAASDLPPVNGEIMLVEGRFKRRLFEARLAAPHWSVDNASAQSTAAHLSLTMASGLDVYLKKVIDTWQPYKIIRMSQLQGPQLHLDLHLDTAPGNLGEQGPVMLDLKDSDNVHLSFADSPEDQRQGGDFFRHWFASLPDAQRIFGLDPLLLGGLSQPGQMDAQPGSFLVTPSQPLVLAGARQPFTTEPAKIGLDWSVEGLSDSMWAIGNVYNNGVYQAPVAADIDGSCVTVRVTATHLLTGNTGSTLVTVLRSSITLDPLIQVCSAGESVTLQAGQMASHALGWSILNPVAGRSGSLQPQGDACTYQAAGEAQVGSLYVLDTIEVRSASSAETALAYVLVQPPVTAVTVQVVADPALGEGRVQLQASTSGMPLPDPDWRLPLGSPGRIEASGIYTANPESPAAFVLILVKGLRMGREVEGHLILPLPLNAFAD